MSDLEYYNSLIRRIRRRQMKEERVVDDVKMSRSFDIKKIDENKKRLREMLIKTKIDRERAMEKAKPEEPKKNNNIVTGNTTLNSLISGFLDTKKKDRRKFIKENSDNFKKLDDNEQKILFKMYNDYL